MAVRQDDPATSIAVNVIAAPNNQLANGGNAQVHVTQVQP